MRPPRKRHWSDNVKRGLAHGYRSGLEDTNAKLIEGAGHPVLYEVFKVKYVVPATLRTYTADFRLPNGIIVETKGVFDATDRAKHLFIKVQYPELDVRFVFSSSRAKINPGAVMTLGEWATKHGYIFADKKIPLSWLSEPGPARSPEEVLKAGPAGFQEFVRKEKKR